jgi:FtsP/CotA-like multicopper oxidase with cupredoxin domain
MSAVAGCSRPPEVQANDNRKPAGTLTGDTLVLRLVVQPARWHPEDDNGVYVDTEVFGEEGGPPQVPAPLIRVKTGTIIKASIRNATADSTLWVRGLLARPVQGPPDSLGVAPGETKTVTFPAGAPGTYVYGANLGIFDQDREREQLLGAFIVDSSGTVPPDRVFVINVWGEEADSTFYRNVLAINGKSFPYTEPISATTGDTIRWRWVNGSFREHPMHMHGFYFTVTSRGTFVGDTTYSVEQRRTAVTEAMTPASTFTMTWVPNRDGRWLFHCHIAHHSTALYGRLELPHEGHMTSANPSQHMAGLVLGMDVKAAPGWQPVARDNPRTLRLFVREGPKLGRAARAMGYAIDHAGSSPTDSLTRVGGPPLILTRGQPTDITVINQLREPTAVHWHGLELESFSDGVSGWSGHPGNLAPLIAPSDSFTARLTMPRAGTFMYHTHLNDLEQLSSGLYGALIVREPRDPFDPATDHLFVMGWDSFDEDRNYLLVNGDSVLAPMTWRAGTRHRLRLIVIGPGGRVDTKLTQDSVVMKWTPVAKDGADLPASQRVARPAQVIDMESGETADFEFTPPKRGEYVLTMFMSDSKAPLTQRIIVR